MPYDIYWSVLLSYSQENITFNRSMASSNISSGVTVTGFMSKVTSSSYAMLRILKDDLFQHLYVFKFKEKGRGRGYNLYRN